MQKANITLSTTMCLVFCPLFSFFAKGTLTAVVVFKRVIVSHRVDKAASFPSPTANHIGSSSLFGLKSTIRAIMASSVESSCSLPEGLYSSAAAAVVVPSLIDSGVCWRAQNCFCAMTSENKSRNPPPALCRDLGRISRPS